VLVWLEAAEAVWIVEIFAKHMAKKLQPISRKKGIVKENKKKTYEKQKRNL